MARPKDTKKDRQPLLEKDFKHIVELTKRSKDINKGTKQKLLRAYTLLYYSGCRVSEIASFTIKDITNIIRTKKHIYEAKNVKTRRDQFIQFNDFAIEQLKKMDLSDCKEAIFYKNGSTKAMKASSLTKLVNGYLEDQLNLLYSTHSFRAGFITQIVEATGNITIAQKLARHSSQKTTLGYVGATQTQIDEALNKVFCNK